MRRKSSTRRRSARTRGMLKYYRLRRGKALLLALAAWPVFQATGCYPDLVGALNFELQSFFNNTLINVVNIIIQNILGQ